MNSKPSKSAENYVYATHYEMFIRMIFQCERGKHGAEVSLLKNLLDAEDGNNYVNIPTAKQLGDIKKYLEKAFKKIESIKLSPVEKEKLEAIKPKLLNSHSGRSMIEPLEKANQILSAFRKVK